MTACKVILSTLAAAFVAAAFAEQPGLYDGKWLVKIEFGTYRGDADMLVSGTTGTWQRRVAARGSENPCAGREVPIVVTRATPDELEYRIEGSKALRGCPDSEVRLKRNGDGAMEGLANNGAKMVHIRK